MAVTFPAGTLVDRHRAGRHRAATTVRSGATLESHNRRRFLDDLAATAGAATVVVDLRALRFFDAAGLRALVTAVRRVHGGGGRIWLRCTPGPVAARLSESGLDQIVPIEMVCTRPGGGRPDGTARCRGGSGGRL